MLPKGDLRSWVYRQERHVDATVTNHAWSLSGLSDRRLVLICTRRSQDSRGSLLIDHSGMEADGAITISSESSGGLALTVSSSLEVTRVTFFVCFESCYETSGILLPQPGSKPSPLALEAQSLNHWTISDVPNTSLLLTSPWSALAT